MYFYIVGREHPSSPDLIMDKLLAYCDSLNITSNIKWINEYLSEEDLARFYKRTDLYVTLFDEITPTSGTLLTAMAHGLPIVSTPYRFAIVNCLFIFRNCFQESAACLFHSKMMSKLQPQSLES